MRLVAILFYFSIFISSLNAKIINDDSMAEIENKIIKYQDCNPFCDGPNCWNLALYMVNINSDLRYTDSDEFSAWLKSPLCTEIDRPLYGDIIAIRYGKKELHGMFNLDKGLVFSKNGRRAKYPYKIFSGDYVEKTYSKMVRTPTEIKFFRCRSLVQYLNESTSNLSSDFLDLNNEITKMSHTMYLAYFEDKLLRSSQTWQLNSNINNLKNKINKIRLRSDLEENDILMLSAFEATLNSLEMNLDSILE